MDVTAQMLSTGGYSVLTAANGQEAVDQYAQRADEIALVVLDMTMPVMDGEEAFREMRRIRPEVRVLLTSGYNEQDATNRFAGKGLAGFIQKPYRAAELLTRVREVLENA
jgi:CheY-like chemotaxis protein